MSDDEASFEVHLRDSTKRGAKSAAESFRKVHKAASGKGVAEVSKDLDATSKHLRKARGSMRSYAVTARKAGKVNPFGEFGKGTGVFRSPAHVSRMWDEMVGGHKRLAAVQHKARMAQGEASFDGLVRGTKGLARNPAFLAAGAATLVGGYAAYQTGEATLSAVKYRDEVLTGLKLITGSAGEANRVFERSIALSDKLGIEWETTVGGMQKLLAKGFTEDFATDLTKGLADLKIVAPDANVGNLLLAIGQIKTAGKLQGDELNQLTEAGLNSDLMFKQLEKSLGKSRAEVLKLKEGGKLLADDVLPAILDSIRTMTGKELGQAAEEAVNTTAGRLRRLEQLPGRFFLSVAEELKRSELDGALGTLLDALDPQSAAYANAVESVAEAVSLTAEGIQVAIPLAKEFGAAFADSLSAFLGIESSDDFFEAWKDPATQAAVKEWGKNLGTIAGALATIVELGAKIADFVSLETMASTIPGVGPALAAAKTLPDGSGKIMRDATTDFFNGDDFFPHLTAARDIAENMVDGFVDTLLGGTGRAREGGVALANATEAGMRSRQGADIHSPSKKTAKVAAFMTEGLTSEFSAGLGDLEKSGQQLGSAPVQGMQSMASKLPPVVPGSAGSRSQGASITVGDITIPISGIDPEAIKDPDALARAIRREIQALFEGVAAQGTIQTDES